MAHNLEQQDGVTAFALRGTPAWHGLANKTWAEGENPTTREMLDGALLSNWNLRLEPVVYPYQSTSEDFYVIRDNPFNNAPEVLSVVGKKYRTYSNESLFSFGDNLLDGGATWESAGSIKGGRQVFGSLRIDNEFTIDSKGVADKVASYLLVTTSHDGGSSVKALVTPVRVVCQNTLNFALNQASASYSFRHTNGAQGKISDARTALGLATAYFNEFSQTAETLFQTSITDKQWDALVKDIYPMPEDTGKANASLTLWQAKRDLLQDLYKVSPTQEGIRGTAWGALNALTERLDYFRGTTMTEAMSASASGFETGINQQKQAIFDRVLALA